MESIVPSSLDLPQASPYDMHAPMGFRRQRYWFLSFVMTPFRDIEPRTQDNPTRRQLVKGRGR
jgi:hypothetical protein